MSRGLKRSILLVGIAVPLLALAGLTGLDRIRRGPDFGGERSISGLDAPVRIVRDSLGVPHVWAESQADALFAQGYLHVRDRLWQMEMFRRIVEGRLSELFGHGTVEADRFLRTLGLGRAARQGAEALEPDVRRLVEAYAAGASAAIRGWEGPLPPELLVLRARPEAWSPALVIGIEKLMAWDLTAYDQALELAAAHRRLGPERYRWIAPSYPEWAPTILDGGAVPGTVANRRSGPVFVPDTTLLAAAAVPEGARPFLAAASAVRASNSWVVGGGRSRSGRPLLANDMHLGLDAPNLWYLMALHAPGLDVVGMTIPGAPGVVAGRTRGVAWGFTNAYVDDADFFVERVDPTDTTRYLAPGGSRPFETRTEVIRVRGADPDTIRVRSTRHGPVLSAVESRAGEDLLAFQWVAHRPSTTAGALIRMNRSGAAAELVDALSSFDTPHQNVVFADTSGAFGYWMAGRVPLRADGTAPVLPVPGWNGEHDWTGFLDFRDHPHVLNPNAGFVVTANNRQARDSVSELISGGLWGDPYRAMRILERVSGVERHDTASMRRIQLDVRSAFARRHRPAAVRAFRRAGLDSAATALDAWDLASVTGSREATLFYAWVDALRSGLRRLLYGDEDDGYVPLRTVPRLLEGEIPDSSDLAAAAASRAMGTAGGRAWGEVHRLVLDHPLRGVPVVGRLFGFGKGPLPREGAHHTVNVAEFGVGPPFRVRTGPSQRHVSDLAAPDGGGFFVLPGGQSGFPGSRHAWNQLALWSEGRLWRLPLEREAVEARGVETLILRPSDPASPLP